MKRKGIIAATILGALLLVSGVQIGMAVSGIDQTDQVDSSLTLELMNYQQEVERGQIYKIFVFGEYSDIANLQFSCSSDQSVAENAWLESDYCAEGTLVVGERETEPRLEIKVVDAETGVTATLGVPVADNEMSTPELQDRLRC